MFFINYFKNIQLKCPANKPVQYITLRNTGCIQLTAKISIGSL